MELGGAYSKNERGKVHVPNLELVFKRKQNEGKTEKEMGRQKIPTFHKTKITKEFHGTGWKKDE